MHRTRLLAVVLVVAATCVGCGGNGSGSSSGASADRPASGSPSPGPTTPASSGTTGADDRYPGAEGACTVLAPSQVEAALGGAGEADGAGGSCRVRVGEKEVDVRVSSLTGAGYASAEAYTADHAKYTATQQPVGGIGDDAYFGLADSELTLVCGGQFVSVQVVLSATSKDLDPTSDKSREKTAATALGTTAADRCPVDIT